MTPLVSILIPAYNAERWVADSIRSALNQSWPNKEIIVVDDGSKDGTLSRLKSFEPMGVHVVSQTNQGAAAARNHAFSLARGDYIQWLDADDLLASDKIETQMLAIDSGCSGATLLSGAWAKFYFRPETAQFAPSPLWADLTPVEWLRRKLGKNCFMQTATWLVSRDLTAAAGPWNTRLLGDDDGEYFNRVIGNADRIKFVAQSKVYYREVGSDRLSAVGYSQKKLEAHFHSMRLNIDFLRRMNDEAETKEACVGYLQRYMYYFYESRPDIVQKMDALAAEMGGTLNPPRVRTKYVWIQTLFGWSLARRAEFFLPKLRGIVARAWDHLLYRIRGPVNI